ncbi:MAG: transposase [Actinobacteria bacterium]|jgi:REP element-mobilizing transposase RayT|nr:MAG: transposase [Actinomycetota bacterium]
MARPLRIQYEDALYHVTARGNEKRDIFKDDRDRNVFLNILSTVVERFKWIPYSFCLMSNHYHLLVRTPKANLSQGMHYQNAVYSQYFNRTHERVGHLFQGRFKAFLIHDEERLLVAARYVVLNPVRAGIVTLPREWKWSSYQDTVGLRRPRISLNPDQLLCFFTSRKDSARKQYITFIEEGIGEESPFLDARGGIIVGENESIEEILSRLAYEIASEVPFRRELLNRPGLEEIFNRHERDEAVYRSFHCYGYTLKEIGGFLDIHYSVVSRIAKRIRENQSLIDD